MDGRVDALKFPDRCVRLGDAVDNLDRHRRLAGGGAGEASQVRLRFHAQDAGDGGRVVREVEPVAGTDLDHLAGEPGEQGLVVFGHAAPLHGLAHQRIEPREERMMHAGAASRAGHHRTGSSASPPVRVRAAWSTPPRRRQVATSAAV
ncbi:hypothetical protein [Streptomyces sp. NPDC048825]|uniref:hypothetical protein n=1 Tax=Streptomyces sp. NPDC048825 TaxID=3365592 RepID=UPI003722414D